MLEVISMVVTIAALASLKPTEVQQERARIPRARSRFRDHIQLLRNGAGQSAPEHHHCPSA